MQTGIEKEIEALRSEFPILKQEINGSPLVYLDNAATTQKPTNVIDAVSNFYKKHNSNVHRGVHYLSNIATEEYEAARTKVQKFINAKESSECVFLRGTTEAINLVATCFGELNIKEDDEILITQMEHHSNIVPWQLLCERTGAKLKVLPMTEIGELKLNELKNYVTDKTKIISVVYVSNSLGTINDVNAITAFAKQKNIPVLIDGAQANSHLEIDVQKLDCDFYTMSAHKMFGPTGIGVLYAKKKWLEKFKPYQGGGEMVLEVTFEKTTYNEVPFKFEAGTSNIAGAVGMGAAIDFINQVGKDLIRKQEKFLLEYANEKLSSISGLNIIGKSPNKTANLSFTLDGIHPHDIGTIVDQDGIAIRTGHHCTMPVMSFYEISGTARASCAFYNTLEEIDKLVVAIEKVKKVFKV